MTVDHVSSREWAQRLSSTKIPTLMFPTPADAGVHVAHVVADLIRENNAASVPTVLGLTTGATPVGMYHELVRLHREEGLDFSKVMAFLPDEYFPMSPDCPQSNHPWMRSHFFDHVNIPEEQIQMPRGDTPLNEVQSYCEEFIAAVDRAGGIQLQILGIGRNGHISFNEPGSSWHSQMRVAKLAPETRADTAGVFGGEENVPRQALTFGISNILAARQVIIMALGHRKAEILSRVLTGEVTEAVPASILQRHRNTIFVIDPAAAGSLVDQDA